MFFEVGDQRAFFLRAAIPDFLRVATPEQKNDTIALFFDGPDNSVGEFLPAFASERAGAALPHGQGRIQQQYPLLRPLRLGAMARHLYIAISFDLFVDVAKARRDFFALGREAKAMRLPLAVIRVLPDDHHFNFLKWG